MNLRVFGGECKGRTIKTPKTQNLRPTTGKIRQAVFNICQSRVKDGIFLDLFAGSGAMGIEALSQGARSAVFVEKHEHQARLIKENLDILGLKSRALVLEKDVFSALQLLKGSFSFDIVYIDPPYHEINLDKIKTLFLTLDSQKLLNRDSILFLEGPYSKEEFLLSLDPQIFVLSKTRRFGRSILQEYNYLR